MENIQKWPDYKFRRLIRFAQEVDQCKYRKQGKTKAGFDDIGLIQFLIKKSFRTRFPGNLSDIKEQGKKINLTETRTGDVAFYLDTTENGVLALILGRYERLIVFPSRENRKVMITKMTDTIENYNFNYCLRFFERERIHAPLHIEMIS